VQRVQHIGDRNDSLLPVGTWCAARLGLPPLLRASRGVKAAGGAAILAQRPQRSTDQVSDPHRPRE
jgi:hypothetical protein